MESPIVTLTTDWGYRDFFSGMVKSRLCNYIPNVRVVDITHGIEPYQLPNAIFVVRQTCPNFPKGTIHIIDVKSSQTLNNPFLVVEHNGQYYICTDNGLPHALFGDDYEHMVIIDGIPQESSFFTFAAYDLFCKVAAMISQGAALSELGIPVESLTRYVPVTNTQHGNDMQTYIAYIDAYGNANLNLSYEEFERERQGRPFEVQVHEMSLKKICTSYTDVESSGNRRAALLLTVSATGLLQLAIREGSAEQLLGLKLFESIVVRFFNK